MAIRIYTIDTIMLSENDFLMKLLSYVTVIMKDSKWLLNMRLATSKNYGKSCNRI